MSAVELLIQQIEKDFYIQVPIQTIRKYKEIEKQQMERCAIFFTNYAIDKIENKTNLKGKEQFEQYYTETYEERRNK